MKRTLFALTMLVGCSAAFQVAKADVSVDFFYDNLSGGSWIEVGNYGYCWQPDVAVGNSDWRPYADGYWAYTDVGWTWVSYEDFGWATYHYGRWARLADLGWVWVPGREQDLEWGPAWVSWRTGDEYIGWAPLPPGEPIYEGRAITGHVDVVFDIGPAYYNFVDIRYIGEPVLRQRIFPSTQNVTYINQTINVTNITYRNKTVYNYGPDLNIVNRRASRPIQRLTIQRENNIDYANVAKSGGLKTRVHGQSLVVAAPSHIAKSAREIAPPAVKSRVAKANLDTGWSSLGDARAKEQFKEKLKNEDLSKARRMGAAADQNPGANVSAGAKADSQGAPEADAQTKGGQGGRGSARESVQQNAPTDLTAPPANGRAFRNRTGEGQPGAGNFQPPPQPGPVSPETATGAEGKHRGERRVIPQDQPQDRGQGRHEGGKKGQGTEGTPVPNP